MIQHGHAFSKQSNGTTDTVTQDIHLTGQLDELPECLQRQAPIQRQPVREYHLRRPEPPVPRLPNLLGLFIHLHHNPYRRRYKSHYALNQHVHPVPSGDVLPRRPLRLPRQPLPILQTFRRNLLSGRRRDPPHISTDNRLQHVVQRRLALLLEVFPSNYTGGCPWSAADRSHGGVYGLLHCRAFMEFCDVHTIWSYLLANISDGSG